MIAQIASELEILIAFLVLVAIGAAGIRLVQEVFSLRQTPPVHKPFSKCWNRRLTLSLESNLLKCLPSTRRGQPLGFCCLRWQDSS